MAGSADGAAPGAGSAPTRVVGARLAMAAVAAMVVLVTAVVVLALRPRHPLRPVATAQARVTSVTVLDGTTASHRRAHPPRQVRSGSCRCGLRCISDVRRFAPVAEQTPASAPNEAAGATSRARMALPSIPSIPSLQSLDRRSDDLLPVIAADKSFPWTLLMYRQASLALLSVVFAVSVPKTLLGKSALLGYVLVDLVFGGLLLFILQRRGRRAPRWLPFIEAAVLVAILAYDPALAGTLLLLALCQFAIASALFGTWPATIATFGLLMAAPVVTEMRGHIFDRTTGLMLGVFVPVVGLINHRVQHNERSARRHEEVCRLLDGQGQCEGGDLCPLPLDQIGRAHV